MITPRENFIRNALIGREWLRKNLGIVPDCCWMADIFGHHPQMPQLGKTCGFKSYMFERGKCGSRIILNGGIDSHHILLDGTPQFVKEKTLEVLSVMSPGGNYIAGASHDTILQQTPVENVLAMCDAVTCFNK